MTEASQGQKATNCPQSAVGELTAPIPRDYDPLATAPRTEHTVGLLGCEFRPSRRAATL